MNRHPDIEQLIHSLPAATAETLLIEDEAMMAADASMQKQNMSTTLKIVSVIGGFLATLAFIGFVFIAGLYDSKIGLVFFGLMLIAAAVLLHKIFQQIMIDTISISSFIFGCTLFSLGMSDLKVGDSTVAILLIVIGIVTLLLIENYLLSFLSLVLIAGAALWLVAETEEPNLFYVYQLVMVIAMYLVYTNEAWFITGNKRISALFDPLLPALMVALAGGFIVTTTESLFNTSPLLAPFPAVVCCILIMMLLQKILSEHQKLTTENYWKIYVAVAVVLAPTIMNPAIAGSLLMVLLSFSINYKTGIALGIVAFLYFISKYYYDLQFTLLTKSIILFSSGIFFLMIYLLVSKKLISNEAH
jgi:Domain of unknown function (DUF4401)